jgi:hypothetical protein
VDRQQVLEWMANHHRENSPQQLQFEQDMLIRFATLDRKLEALGEALREASSKGEQAAPPL